MVILIRLDKKKLKINDVLKAFLILSVRGKTG